jgi:hypothetical protein
VGISAASGAISGAITAACPCMGPIATGLVQGSLSAATYAATEKFAYGRDPSVKDVIVTGVVSGVMAGGMKFLAQEAGAVQCFVAGTLVAAKPGLIPIENIQPGDLVWATDPDTGETALKRVVRTFKNESEELVHLTVNGEEIVTTPGHPFYVPVKGWTKAIQLRAGDRLQLLNGQYVVVEQVQHELLENPVFIYNFEVEDFHTYYVGSNPVLVHNKRCGGDSFPKKGKANSTSIRYGSNGKIYSAATYDSNGIKIARIDFQGKEHFIKSIGKPLLPHVHIFENNNGFIKEATNAITIEEFLMRF